MVNGLMVSLSYPGPICLACQLALLVSLPSPKPSLELHGASDRTIRTLSVAAMY